MSVLPDGVAAYRRTPVFTAESVPAGLLKDHALASGVWGLLCVERGRLIFRDAATGEATALSAGERHVIPPERLHSVELDADAAFFVEFCR